jgi:ribosomal protein L11
MYWWPNEDFISLMFTSGSLESSRRTGSHCELSRPMSNSIGPAGVSIHGMCALTDGKTSLAQGGSLVSATVVISTTSKAQITW